jgi:predicted 2-oxoglutarate/Fe(II)-dependent dioxygenase YbiX
VLTVDDSRRFERQILLRLQSEVQKCFSFTLTHYDGFKIGCYEADTRGFFGPHRDNKNERNAHWRFAMSLNLNDDYEGGCLRFPEFSDALFKPEPGAAIVFSCSLLHEATAVTAGRRFVLLTFLYAKDDAARALRLNGFGGYPLPTIAREAARAPQKQARRR